MMHGTEYKSQSLEKALFDSKTQYILKEVVVNHFFFMSKVREFFEGNTCYTVDIKEV